jgi:hypothetical protein
MKSPLLTFPLSPLLLVLIGIVPLYPATAQVITTNIVTAAPNFRVVAGQLYNINRSKNWGREHGRVQQVTNGMILLRHEDEKAARGRGISWNTGDAYSRMGLGAGGSEKYIPGPIISRETVLGSFFYVTNYPVPLESGDWLAVDVMKVRQITNHIGIVAVYDYGVPHVVSLVKTNENLKIKR